LWRSVKNQALGKGQKNAFSRPESWYQKKKGKELIQKRGTSYRFGFILNKKGKGTAF